MIDGLTVKVPPTTNTLMALPLAWKVDTSTGEIKKHVKPFKNGTRVTEWANAEIKGLHFSHGLGELKYNNGEVVKIESLVFKGSLHIYHNDGHHNCDDYTHTALVRDIYDLQCRYGVNPSLAELQTLEFGVNLRIPLTVSEFVRVIKTYKRAQYKRIAFEGAVALHFDLQQYSLKVYSKGDQWQVGSNLLRFEVKVKKSEYLKRLGIHYLADLTKIDVWHTLESELLKIFNRLTICRDARKLRLKPSEQLLLANFKDKDFWLELNPNRYKHYRKSKLLKSGNILRGVISELIKEKCLELRTQVH